MAAPLANCRDEWEDGLSMIKRKMQGMGIGRYLGWLFILAVVVPSGFLVLIALRSIEREEAYVERGLEDTLLAEITHMRSLVRAELDEIRNDLLDSTTPDLTEWETAAPLVETAFLISPDGEILWPDIRSDLSDGQISFLRWNTDFLLNERPIPVYRNIADAYRDEIVNAYRGEISGADRDGIAVPETALSLPAGSEKDLSAPPEAELSMPAPAAAQQAMSQFQRNTTVQKKIYEKAKEEGQLTLTRTVSPTNVSQTADEFATESIFVSEDLHFDEITKTGDSGLIPRFIENQFRLLFWQRQTEGRIVGCLISDTVLRDRLVLIPDEAYNPVRILTILDDQGNPLFRPVETIERDYTRPFAAREISEMLPRWEAAAYLTDPETVAARVRSTRLFLWFFISLLAVSILSGGTLVLRALREEIRLAGQKTTFVANVSHELKTPLTSIRMFAEMLKDGKNPQKQDRYLGIMVSETERLTRLINNVLDFSRIERGKHSYDKKNLDIDSLCRDLVEQQKIRLEQAGFSVTYCPLSGSDEDRRVYADEGALQQALLNLISNAEKYSEQQKSIELELKRETGAIVIAVKDRGWGIAPQHRRNIFKEFYRVEEKLTSKTRGTGLGLPIARRIAEDHGGEIRYLPRQGGGSIFEIRLPPAESMERMREADR